MRGDEREVQPTKEAPMLRTTMIVFGTVLALGSTMLSAAVSDHCRTELMSALVMAPLMALSEGVILVSPTRAASGSPTVKTPYSNIA